MGIELTSGERSFFELVRAAIAANPFSESRKALDIQIAGRYDQRPSTRVIDEAIREVGDRIQKLVSQDRAQFHMYHGEDRELVRSAFLFDLFHWLIPQFDQLIIEQVEAEDRQLPVYFATEALARLRNRGFSKAEACRYFELFFQMRRAFYFIQQSLIGRCPCMVMLRESLWNTIFTHSIHLYDEHLWNRMEDFSTMILGPTGAGKGTAAAAIGRSGYIPYDAKKNTFVENFTTAFISINLSQYSETLIESELFGHKKGAFTGAIENYQGVFDRCSPYGSILLDEIGRGTSTYDGVSIAWAVTEHLHEWVGAKTIFATHYHELTQLGDLLPQVRNLNVAVREVGEDIVFLRRLEEGGADRSYGIQVARLAGLPPELLARARELLTELEGTHSGGGHGLGRGGAHRPASEPPLDQLSLFAPEHPVVSWLRELEVEGLTPLEALNLLAQMKAEALGKGNKEE